MHDFMHLSLMCSPTSCEFEVGSPVFFILFYVALTHSISTTVYRIKSTFEQFMFTHVNRFAPFLFSSHPSADFQESNAHYRLNVVSNRIECATVSCRRRGQLPAYAGCFCRVTRISNDFRGGRPPCGCVSHSSHFFVELCPGRIPFRYGKPIIPFGSGDKRSISPAEARHFFSIGTAASGTSVQYHSLNFPLSKHPMPTLPGIRRFGSISFDARDGIPLPKHNFFFVRQARG